MANGEMLKELRSLAQAEKVQTPTALRLMCSAIADIFDQVKIVVAAQEFYKAELALLQDDLCNHKDENDDGHRAISQENNRRLTELADKVDKAIGKIDDLSKTVRSNPAVIIGQFIKDHPKWAALIGFFIFVFFNLWFVPEFRRAALIVLQVPPEIIEVVAP